MSKIYRTHLIIAICLVLAGSLIHPVVLRAVFSSSGAVTSIHPVSELPDGLTDKAIAAAQQIRFIPAIKDGRFVSMWIQLEYNFNLF
jgi:hypothetical protein